MTARKAAQAAFLFVTDPWATLDHPKDTTLRLMEECLTLGVSASWCDVRTIRLESGRVRLEAQRLRRVGPASERTSSAFTWDAMRTLEPSRFSRILYRTDPPVDLAYLHPLQLLASGLEGHPKSELVNRPEVLFQKSEKIEAAILGNLAPRSVVSSQLEVLEKFGLAQGRAVLKPLHEAQSKGVLLLDFERDPSQARSQLLQATHQGSQPVILQQYLPKIQKNGELRLWFLNGKLLAHVQKNPKPGEFRIDMDRGGFLSACDLTRADRRAAQKIGQRLRQLKVRLAAVDLIAGRVTDFNLTSPGLLVPMESVLQRNLARPVIESLLKPWR
jgi:glutathione synthase